MADEITRLRQLQARINARIDQHVALLESDKDDEIRVSESQRAIQGAIADLNSEVLNPILEIFNVSLLWFVPVTMALALRMGVFEHVTKHTPFDELVLHTKADPDLLMRILRLLTSYKYLVQEEDGTYSSTRLGEKLRQPVFKAWTEICATDHTAYCNEIVPFLVRHKFQDPSNLAINMSKETLGKTFFEFVNESPERVGRFAKAMEMADTLPRYRDVHLPFPSDLLAEPQSSNKVTIVDIGGGHGQAMQSILQTYPNLPGRIILQDLPEVIQGFNKSKSSDSRIEGMEYDFFTPQPVKGARYYHLRFILHDWSDRDSIKILSRIREAMDPVSSRCVISERIIPDRDVEQGDVLIDMLMMCMSGRERDLKQWQNVFHQAGLKVVNIYHAPVGSKAIIELAVDENWSGP